MSRNSTSPVVVASPSITSDAIAIDRLDLIASAEQQDETPDNEDDGEEDQGEEGRSSQSDGIKAKSRARSGNSSSSSTSSPAAPPQHGKKAERRRRMIPLVVRDEDRLEYGPEVFDMFKVVFGGMVGYHQPWPNWLRYNMLFWVMYLGGMGLMVIGDRFHRLIGQGGAVPDETLSERRLRIHWVYTFDAYLLCCMLWYLLDVLVALTTPYRQQGDVVFGGSLIIISFVWLLCNAYGLSAMFRKSAVMMKMYITANVGWTVLLLLLLVAELVGYRHFRTAIAFHVLTVFFFLIFDYVYFIGMWNVYPLQPYHCVVVPVAVLLTVALLLVAMFTCVHSAKSELWYLISGTF